MSVIKNNIENELMKNEDGHTNTADLLLSSLLEFVFLVLFSNPIRVCIFSVIFKHI